MLLYKHLSTHICWSPMYVLLPITFIAYIFNGVSVCMSVLLSIFPESCLSVCLIFTAVTALMSFFVSTGRYLFHEFMCASPCSSFLCLYLSLFPYMRLYIYAYLFQLFTLLCHLVCSFFLCLLFSSIISSSMCVHLSEYLNKSNQRIKTISLI